MKLPVPEGANVGATAKSPFSVNPTGLPSPEAKGDGGSDELTVPPPKGVTECYFVGIVAHMDLSKDEKPSEQTPMSYFTLEQGVGEDMQTSRTVLCQWSKEGEHDNFGDGPPAEARAFADAIEQVLAARSGGGAAGFHRQAAANLPGQQ